MSDDDPLRNADLGESVTVRETSEIWIGGLLTDDVADGSDRIADTEIVDIEVRTDEYGERYLDVTTESEVTKRLPSRWDESNAPRTDSERRSQRRQRWGGRLARLLPIPVTLGIGLVVTDYVMAGAAGDVTINGAPLTYTTWDLVPVVAIVLIVVLILFAIPVLPRPGPRGDRR